MITIKDAATTPIIDADLSRGPKVMCTTEKTSPCDPDCDSKQISANQATMEIDVK